MGKAVDGAATRRSVRVPLEKEYNPQLVFEKQQCFRYPCRRKRCKAMDKLFLMCNDFFFKFCFFCIQSSAKNAQNVLLVTQPANAPSQKTDPREYDLAIAKQLCEISEDELCQKSVDDLEAIVKQLLQYNSKMHQQANYWLDAKEQLLMDAEMHNKMISSLVQYAQQLQVQPKGNEFLFSISVQVY